MELRERTHRSPAVRHLRAAATRYPWRYRACANEWRQEILRAAMSLHGAMVLANQVGTHPSQALRLAHVETCVGALTNREHEEDNTHTARRTIR